MFKRFLSGFPLFTIGYRWFWLLFGLAIVIRLVLVWLLPFGQTVKYGLEGLNDEPSHFNYVKYLAENREFPVQMESSKSAQAFEHNVYEYYQPPLFYLATSLFVPITGINGALFAGRLISCFFGIMTLIFLGNVLNRICKSKKVIAAGVLICAFFPTHMYFCSLLSNDSLSWFAGIWLLDLIMNYDNIPDKKRYWFSLYISLALALAMMIKSSSFVYYPIVAYAFFYGFLKRGERKLLWWGFVSILFSFILVSPWYLRNLHLYGSLFAIDIGFGPSGKYLCSIFEVAQFCARTSRLFWFPMQHVSNYGVWVSVINCIGPLLILLFTSIAFIDTWIRVSQKKLSFYEQILWLTLILSVIAYIKLNMSWANAEGRYLFSALAPIVAIFSASPARLFAERRKPYQWILTYAAVLYGYVYFLLI